MLKKLMKYDIKKMTRIIIFMYAISIALAGITRLIYIGKDIQFLNILGGIFAGLTYSAIANVLINTFIHIINIFIQSFYKDQSYLTHTLPLKKNKLLLSKYLSGLVVIICSLLVSFISLFIVLYSKELMNSLKAMLEIVVTNLNISSELFIILIILVLFTQICSMMSMGLTAIVKGYSYNSKRGLKGLIWFLIFYFGSTIATLLIAVIIFAISGNLTILFAKTLTQSALITLLILALVLYTIYSITFYFICQREFNKGVNVD